MTWLSILAGFLKLAGALAEWLKSRQLLEAGEAQAIATHLEGALKNVELAKAARGKLDDPGERERLRDKFTRPD